MVDSRIQELASRLLALGVGAGDIQEYSNGGKIHIKPENRGKFTALKKRTGKSASWFKAHGTPAQKKMAVFALNARKWKHADGGLIHRFDEGTPGKYAVQMPADVEYLSRGNVPVPTIETYPEELIDLASGLGVDKQEPVDTSQWRENKMRQLIDEYERTHRPDANPYVDAATTLSKEASPYTKVHADAVAYAAKMLGGDPEVARKTVMDEARAFDRKGLAAMLAAPVVGGAIMESPALWGKAGLRMLKDLPAFEVADRIPTLWGDGRITEQGGDVLERAYRSVLPDGKFADVTAPYVNTAGQFLFGAVPGAAGDALMRSGARAGMGLLRFNDRLKAPFEVGDMSGMARSLAQDPRAEFPSKYKVQPNEGFVEPAETGIDLAPLDELSTYDRMVKKELNTVVDEAGNINKAGLQQAYKRLLDYVDRNFPGKRHSIKEIYGSSNGSTTLKDHVASVVKTAQEIPVPAGSSRAEFVRAALTHDIGKIVTGQEAGHYKHGYIGKDILEGLGLDEFSSPTLRSAVALHMDDHRNPIYGSHGMGVGYDSNHNPYDVNWDLLRALQAADVARGLSYDEAAVSFPWLFTYNRANPTLLNPYVITQTPEWQMKHIVNPILQRQGYPLARNMQDLKDRILQHRTFIRAVRDPYKTHGDPYGPVTSPIGDADDVRNALNASKLALQEYGADTAENRLKVSLENVSLDPTGSGRLGIFNTKIGAGHMTEHSGTLMSRRIKASPKKQDAVYVSVSPDLASNYHAQRHPRPAETAKVNFPVDNTNEFSPANFLLDNEWQLYDLNAVANSRAGEYVGEMSRFTSRKNRYGYQMPLSRWQLFEEPYRLQTGRSLQSDMARDYAELKGADQSRTIKRSAFTEYGRGNARGMAVQRVADAMKRFGDKSFSPAIINVGGVEKPLAEVTEAELLDSNTLIRANEEAFNVLSSDIRRFQDYIMYGGNNNRLPFITDKQWKLARMLSKKANIMFEYVPKTKVDSNVKQQILDLVPGKYPEATKEVKKILDNYTFSVDSNGKKVVIKTPHNRSSTDGSLHFNQDLDVLTYALRDAIYDSTEQDFSGDYDLYLADQIHAIITNPRHRNLSLAEHMDRREQAFKDFEKYIFNKSTYNKIKDDYFKRIKELSKKRRMPSDEYMLYLKDPVSIADYMRSKGTVPLYDLPTFGRVEAFANNDWGRKPISRNARPTLPASQAYVIGKHGEKIFESTEIPESVLKDFAEGKIDGGRDSGWRLLTEDPRLLITRKTFPWGGLLRLFRSKPAVEAASPAPVVVDYSGLKTTNNRKYNPEYISYISDSLKNSGISDIQRASILANIIEESGGNPFALDKTGKFYGLLQWAGDRYAPTKEKDVYKEIDNQLKYITDTLGNSTDKKSWTHGGTGSGYNSLTDAMADFDSDDLDTVMKGFTLGYVRPTGKIDSYNNRLKVAKQLYGLKGFRSYD